MPNLYQNYDCLSFKKMRFCDRYGMFPLICRIFTGCAAINKDENEEKIMESTQKHHTFASTKLFIHNLKN